MAKIEKEQVCQLVAEGVTYGDNTLFYIFSFIYIVLHKEDCAILQICWAAGL